MGQEETERYFLIMGLTEGVKEITEYTDISLSKTVENQFKFKAI